MKMNLIAVAISGAMLISGAASGLDLDPKFYAGVEAQYNKLKPGSDVALDANGKSILTKKKVPGAGLFLGTRLNEFFGVEAGYSFLKTSKNTLADKETVSVKMGTPYIDAMGYVPVGCDVDVIGSVGLGRLHTKLQHKDVQGKVLAVSDADKKSSKSKAGIRLGLGAQYKFDTNFGARVMVRHQKGNKIIKNVNSVGAGLFYQF